ncbi:MAG: TAXI family TRAP transporter solute-binding subunit [Rhodospirillales bacterium]|nr:MAG: TAXI family TRAP transporter solute-binding subunit [Rhodospirillales bacterium]
MIKRRDALAGSAAMMLGGAAQAKLPETSIWTAYDLGSSGYAEASGIADAIMKKQQMRVRIVPSGTSIGRLLPLKQGKANYGFLANELYFAAEGTFDFAVPAWGPQDVRVVLARPASNAMATAADIGVKEVKDLKGKRIGYVKGNPSVNVKTDAYLAFAGLTRADVQVVWFGSYNAMKTAVINNQLDSFSSVTTSANMREIEASPRGLVYPPFPPSDKAGWDRIRKVADFFEPYRETVGAGIPKDKAVDLVGYRYPIIATYSNTNADEVYSIVKVVDDSMDLIRGITGSAANWAPKIAGKPPADAPWHDGAIRYLKEKGIWTAEHQAWQDQRLARLKKVQAGWDAARKTFKGQGDEAWVKHWEEYRVKTMGLPPTDA